jgi:AraC-like DNA-binding protein
VKYTPNIFSDYTKHFHSHLGLALIEKGSVEITYELDTKCNLTHDTIAVFNPKQIHRSKTQNAKGYYVLFLDINWCQNIQKDFFFEKNIIDNPLLCTKLRKLFHKIIVDKVTIVESELKDIMKELFKKYTSVNIQKDKEVIIRLKTFISQNRDTPLNVDKLSKYIGYNKSYLIRLFKKEVGLTPQQYILNEKVNRVKDTLTYSKPDSLSSIALDAGFFDQSHMNRNFKGSFGTSPQTYKKVNTVQDM